MLCWELPEMYRNPPKPYTLHPRCMGMRILNPQTQTAKTKPLRTLAGLRVEADQRHERRSLTRAAGVGLPNPQAPEPLFLKSRSTYPPPPQTLKSQSPQPLALNP